MYSNKESYELINFERLNQNNYNLPNNYGLKFSHFYSNPEKHPFSLTEWELRTAKINSDKGTVIFQQDNVEVPKFWSSTATNIVVSKYFHGLINTPDRENSVKQIINRVTRTITLWGLKDGYFATIDDAKAFYYELTYLLVNQFASFNSPVWFNVGIEEKPQCSACFINSVQDTMESILDLAKTEGMLFKYGSGAGSNLSVLRSSKESLSGGGSASGPVSFMKGFDAFAGVIKSGGKTRRAAKMVILNADHPDIVEFINCKAEEEKKAHALIEMGYNAGFNVTGGAYDSINYQNANHSVRASDEFMRAAESNSQWQTKSVKDKTPAETLQARDLLKQISESAWLCGDPGMQFDTTINKWHTCANTARINASNPCSEYMFLDDSACNLASLNLMKFLDKQGNFDVIGFKHACDVFITAQEILVDNSSYPTPKIGMNSHEYRPLGLGYANLGSLLMFNGIPYDSEAGRAFAAAITSIMGGEAYKQSSIISSKKGPFLGYERNRDTMLKVMKQHAAEAKKIEGSLIPLDLFNEAVDIWEEVNVLGTKYGFRNAQVTVLAPTGTIGFMMDCDTTGIEPDLAIIKYKSLVGGGSIKIVNTTIPFALSKLGYDQEQIEQILAFINTNDTVEGAPYLLEEHLSIFDCAFKPRNGSRTIHYMGHIKMMAAVQPFLSGAISKTVNLPNEITPEEIQEVYIQGWKLGLKAIAVYRDGSKRTQPLNTSNKTDKKKKDQKSGSVLINEGQPYRKRLPDERKSVTHKFSIAGHEGYITVGMYEDGQPGEIFIVMSKEGSVVSGLMDAFATAISLALQYGVPLKILVDKFIHTRFEPSGFTNNKDIPIAKSVMDYIFRWLTQKFLKADENDGYSNQVVQAQPAIPRVEKAKATVSKSNDLFSAATLFEQNEKKIFVSQADAPACTNCGSIMTRRGSCYVCDSCGGTTGCS